MEYKASLGTSARIITAGVTLLFSSIVVFSLVEVLDPGTDLHEMSVTVFIILLLIAIYAICYLFRPLGYVLEHDGITIRRPIRNVKIPYTEIAEVFQAAPETMKWTMRTFGNGGLFGIYGKFWNKNYGNMTWYATRTDNMIVLITKSAQKIVLTPDQISMLDEVGRRLKPLNMQYEE